MFDPQWKFIINTVKPLYYEFSAIPNYWKWFQAITYVVKVFFDLVPLILGALRTDKSTMIFVKRTQVLFIISVISKF